MAHPNHNRGGARGGFPFTSALKHSRTSRIIVALALVLAVATSLWFAAPTQAFDVTFPSLPTSGTVASSYTFTTKLDITDTELLPISSVTLYIYKADARSTYQASASLPRNTGSVTYSHAQTGGGIIGVIATAGAGWGWGYGYGYAAWQGTGYRFFPPGGYGYGYGGAGAPTSMTYSIEWVSPTGWPVGSYKVEIKVIATGGATFIKTSSAFTLSTPAAPAAPTPSQVEQMSTAAAAAAVEQMTAEQAATVLEQISTAKAAAIIAAVGTEKAADVIEQMTTTKAADIVEQLNATTAASIMEQVATTKAADIIEQVDTTKAAGIVEQITTTKAAAIVQDVDTSKAAGIVELLTTDKAAGIVENITTTKAAGIIENVTTPKAADIIGQVTTAKAAAIIENVTTIKAANIIEQVADLKSAAILEQVAPDKAAAVMQNLTTDKLTNTIPAMSETSLTERLPGLTPEKLYTIDPKVLFSSLPNAPREQLVSEKPPQPPAEAKAPVVVYTTPSGAEYLAVQTWAGEWVVVVGTPPPVDNLLIKTKQAQTNVKTKLEVFDKAPTGTGALPADKIVRAYITIDFDEATLANIEVGHMTFKVEKDWLEKNSIHKWSVALNRFDPDLKQWMALPTKRIKEDANYIYYTVAITRFSTFAITGSKILPAQGFNTANLKITPTSAKTGEPVTITADVSNVSGTSGTFAITLWVNGTVETGKNVSLNAGETKPVSFTLSRDIEGTYEVRVDRLIGSFKVSKAPPTPVPAAFTVSQLSITPTAVNAGENVLISALVTNTGDLSGTYKVNLKLNGAVAASTDIVLAGKASQTVTFSISRDAAGTYSVDVNGLQGTFTVKAPLTPTPTPTEVNWSLVGGIIAGVIAIVVVLILIIRRERARRAFR